MITFILPFEYLRSTKTQVKQKSDVTRNLIGIDQEPIEAATDRLVNDPQFIKLTRAENKDLAKNPDKYLSLSKKYKDFLK